MRRARQIRQTQPEWIDGDFYLHVNANPVTIEPGSRQRVMPCVICATPVGGAQCFLLCLVAGLLCPKDGSHLGGLGTFCHVRCLPQSDKALVEAMQRLLVGAGH